MVKRSAYDGEYDRVRRAAAAQADFESLKSPRELEQFEIENRELVERRRQEFLVRAEKMKADEHAAEAKAKIARTAFSKNASARLRRREYEAAGVLPPHVDENGEPTCSLALLLTMGWRLECYSGENVLVKPMEPHANWPSFEDRPFGMPLGSDPEPGGEV